MWKFGSRQMLHLQGHGHPETNTLDSREPLIP